MPAPAKAPRLADNPAAGADFDKMDPSAGPFFVLNHHVGTGHPGAVVSARDLGPGAQLQRLADSGAISPASPDQADAYLGKLPEPEPAAPAPTTTEPPAKPDAPKSDAFTQPPKK